MMRPQQDCAESRRERQRVNGRQEHRDRDGDGELPEQFAGNAGNKGDRHEHRQQHQRDRDDRRENALHGELGRVRRRKLGMRLHTLLDRFDHDDGVVDHDADRQDHGEQRDRVGGIADGVQHDEGADQADGNRDHRDQRGADVAEENEHHKQHQEAASTSVCITFSIVAVTNVVGS